MEDRVVGLDGLPLSAQPGVDAALVEVLESLLADARSGQLTSFALAAVWRGSGASTSYHVGRDDSCVLLMGCVARLSSNLDRDMDADERSR